MVEKQKVRQIVGWRHRDTAVRGTKFRMRTTNTTYKMVSLVQKKKV
jgi:hypothetical protein